MVSIKLRPHHVEFMQGHIDSLKNRHVSPEYKTTVAQERKRFARVYGPGGLAKIDGLAMDIINDPGAHIQVVYGPDEICGGCRFNESCTRGNYDEVRKAYEAAEWKLSKDGTPETADKEAAKRLGLQDTDKDKNIHPASRFFE